MSADNQAAAASLRRPPVEMTQSNVELANSYRIELNKQILTIAAALFAFTIAFFTPSTAAPRGTAVTMDFKWLALAGWAALAVSIGCGLWQMRLWERFYISYRDFDNRGAPQDVETGRFAREKITDIRRPVAVVQYVAFAIGLIAVGSFAAIRLGG